MPKVQQPAPIKPSLASTQDHLDILDIAGNLVLLKTGGAALVLQATSVNFDLLSEREQDAMIAAYSALLNSLSFPIQILINSRKLDLSAYLAKVDEQAKASTQANPYLKEKISSYKEFIVSLVQKGEVLDKRFYIVIPYFGEVTLAPQAGIFGFLFGGGKKKTLRINRAVLLEKAKIDLEPKRDHLIKQLERLGIKSRQLTTSELIELYYEIYNPDQARVQHITGGAANYTTSLIEPAVKGETKQ